MIEMVILLMPNGSPEPEIFFFAEKKPKIASVTFGQERPFHFKHKKNTSLKKKIVLKHGSLLLMQGLTQEYWLHQIPKTTRQIGPRINLTFRIIPSKLKYLRYLLHC